MIQEVLEAVAAGDLKRAMQVQAVIDPLRDATYGGGEPSGEAHANMEPAMAAGLIDRGTVRPPTIAPAPEELACIVPAVDAAGPTRESAI